MIHALAEAEKNSRTVMAKTNNDLAKYIDHTLLKPESTAQQIEKLCKEAIQYGFFAVCVPPYFVKQAKHFLEKAYMDSEKIALLRKEANQSIFEKTHILNWEEDNSRYDWITFKGYEAKYKPSFVSGQKRLYYDRNSPYEKKIKFYNYSIKIR